jgi:hypothetical protein
MGDGDTALGWSDAASGECHPALGEVTLDIECPRRGDGCGRSGLE